MHLFGHTARSRIVSIRPQSSNLTSNRGHQRFRCVHEVHDPTMATKLTPTLNAEDDNPLLSQAKVAQDDRFELVRFAAGMRAILALVAVFTLMSAQADSALSIQIWFTLAYTTLAAVVLAITMHLRQASRWAVWFWIDAAWIVTICNTGLSDVPGVAALLMLPIIVLALNFSVEHAVGLAAASAAALMLPYWTLDADATTNLRMLPFAHVGVALSVVVSGPLAVWLLRPARASRRRTQILTALASTTSPRHGLALNAQRLLDLLSQNYDFAQAVLSLGGPEPRIFRWTRSQRLRTLSDDEAGVVAVRLARVHASVTLTRDELGHSLARAVDRQQGTVETLGDAASWIWITTQGCGIVLPLQSFGQSIGHLWLSDAASPFTPDDACWLGDTMAAAMPLLERADLMEQLQREGAMHERERIGRDLHDSAVQPYVGLKYGLEALVRQSGADNPASCGLRQLLELTNTELQRLRDVVSGLRKGDAHDASESPMAAIERHAKRFETIYGLKVQIFAPNASRLHGAIGKHVLHIVNEAMTNVRRHTGAKAINILIDVDGRDIVLRLRNDHGTREALPEHFVPTSIQQRARDLGGTVAVHRDQGFTEVSVRLPTVGVLG